jgi:DNA adenine methylase
MIPYIGGKYRQSKWMESFLPYKVEKYAEVFGGAMWFYIKSNVKPQISYYNDIDPLMVNLFSCFKMYEDFINGIKDYPTYNNDVFQKMKKIIQSNAKKEIEIPNMEFAIAHVYVITHIFSGFTKDIWRPNLNMVKKRPSSADYMNDHAVIKKLKDKNIRRKLDILQISCESFENFIYRVDRKDLFLYLDPPYWKTETHYRIGDFNKNDHEKLSLMLKNIK